MQPAKETNMVHPERRYESMEALQYAAKTMTIEGRAGLVQLTSMDSLREQRPEQRDVANRTAYVEPFTYPAFPSISWQEAYAIVNEEKEDRRRWVEHLKAQVKNLETQNQNARPQGQPARPQDQHTRPQMQSARPQRQQAVVQGQIKPEHPQPPRDMPHFTIARTTADTGKSGSERSRQQSGSHQIPAGQQVAEQAQSMAPLSEPLDECQETDLYLEWETPESTSDHEDMTQRAAQPTSQQAVLDSVMHEGVASQPVMPPLCIPAAAATVDASIVEAAIAAVHSASQMTVDPSPSSPLAPAASRKGKEVADGPEEPMNLKRQLAQMDATAGLAGIAAHKRQKTEHEEVASPGQPAETPAGDATPAASQLGTWAEQESYKRIMATMDNLSLYLLTTYSLVSHGEKLPDDVAEKHDRDIALMQELVDKLLQESEE